MNTLLTGPDTLKPAVYYYVQEAYPGVLELIEQGVTIRRAVARYKLNPHTFRQHLTGRQWLEVLYARIAFSTGDLVKFRHDGHLDTF